MIRGVRALVAVGLTALALGGATPDGTSTVIGKVFVQPLQVDLQLVQNEAVTGQRVRVVATVHNRGTSRLHDLRVLLRHPDGLVVSPHAPRRVAVLHGSASSSVQWIVCAETVGAYGLLAQVRVTLVDGRDVLAESPTSVLLAAAEGTATCPP